MEKADRLKYTEKAQELVDGLTLEQKVSLMSGTISLEEMISDMDGNKHYNYIPYPAGGIEEKNIPAMKFCDGPRGVVCDTGKSTCFPVSMLRGATFDTELEERIGKAIGQEVKGYGGNLFAGVCINLPYNPGWGRSQETYGEESFHLGQMGSALTRGVQSENVIACLKHFAFNSMEISRFKVDVNCSKRTEREVFLPHFKDCIDSGAASVMSAYNLYKGVHCGHSKYLLSEILKDEWDFDGFVMTDFVWGMRETVDPANNGLDMEMPNTNFYGENLIKAVKEGKVSEDKIDKAALRIIRTLIAFADTDSTEIDESGIGSDEHISLALEAARKGITLIQNDQNVLPINRNKTKKIAVFGKLAQTANIGDHGSSRVFPKYVITPLQGLEKNSPEIEYIFDEGNDLEYSKKLAREVDNIIFVVGYDHDDEGEFISEDEAEGYTDTIGGDRVDSLGLHQDEIELIKQVGPENKNSIVVLIGGNMIMMDEWKNDVNSILMAYYPGMEGGTAIADIIFGDVNPSGKLPYVIPKKESDLPQVNWDTESQYYEYYHGYAKLDKEGIEPSVPYGFGLSYTTFDISNAEFEANDDEIIASCLVKNTGEVCGTEVVQVYVGFENSAIDRPLKLLRGFSRIELEPKESKKVKIHVPIEKLKWFNEETNSWELENIPYQIYIGNSSANNDLIKETINLKK